MTKIGTISTLPKDVVSCEISRQARRLPPTLRAAASPEIYPFNGLYNATFAPHSGKRGNSSPSSSPPAAARSKT